MSNTPQFFIPKKQGTPQKDAPTMRPPTMDELAYGGKSDSLDFENGNSNPVSTPYQPKNDSTSSNKPPPPKDTIPLEFGQDFEKLGLKEKTVTGNQSITINLKEPEKLPRPVLGQNQVFVHQPDVTPLFARYNKTDPVDYSRAQAGSQFCRSTIQCVPSNPQLLSKWSLPFGAIFRPFAPQGDEKIPVYNFGTCGVVRCFNCRTFINPFVSFHEDGRKWQCNMCKCLNQVHQDYYAPLDQSGKRVDQSKHPELLNGCIEFIAPKEYLSRTPQPACFFFVIEVTKNTVESGMVACIADAILASLDSLGKRTQIGFITYDDSVHFYNLSKELQSPQMLVSGDLTDAILPIPSGLLVDVQDSKHVIKKFLSSLKTMFSHTTIVQSCLGAALNSAGRVLSQMGGKLCVFMATLPTLGPLPLVNRETQNLEEKILLSPGNKDYKELALVFAKDQISVDLFVATSTHVDLSTLHVLPKYTTGHCKFYPGFSIDINGEKLYTDISKLMTRETGYEAVMRVRVSTGLKVLNYYGNTFPRNAGLLGLPTCDEDSTFAVEIVHEGNLISTSNAAIQVALVYTTSFGERRIRCQTITLPITSSLEDMYRHADINAQISLMAKIAVDESLRNGLIATRNKLRDWVVGSVKGFKTRGHDFQIPHSLALLPLYTQSLAKSYALCSDLAVKVDLRIASGDVLLDTSIETLILNIHPDLYAVHEKLEVPKLIPLTSHALNPQGIYLMDDANTLYLYVGDKASKETEDEIFEGCNHLVNPQKHPIKSELAEYFVMLVKHCRKQSGDMNIRLIRQNGSLDKLFSRRLTEDKTSASMGYVDFLVHIQKLSETQF
jgi:protein transport protein SEC24